MLPRLCSPSLLELPLPACLSPHHCGETEQHLARPAQNLLLQETERDEGATPPLLLAKAQPVSQIEEKKTENLLLLIFVLAFERQTAVLSKLDCSD